MQKIRKFEQSKLLASNFTILRCTRNNWKSLAKFRKRLAIHTSKQHKI